MAQDPMGTALSVLRKVSSSTVLERLGLDKSAEKAIYQGTKVGYKFLGQANKTLSKVPFPSSVKPSNDSAKDGKQAAPLFDLSLSEEQLAFVDSIERLGEDLIRPAADEADSNSNTPTELLAEIHALGLNYAAIPEAYGGVGEQRSPVTQAVIVEALAKADLSIALAALAPLAVINALVQWGNAEQRETYLPAFLGERFIAAAMALQEPQALFDPLKLKAEAVLTGNGFVLSGKKVMVPMAAHAGLLLVAAELRGVGPQMFLVDPSMEGVSITATPNMGLRAAAIATVEFKDVALSASALLGGESGRPSAAFDYQQLLDLCRIAWAAMAVGCSQAVLDYVALYVKDRKAFGEPVAQRQSVAFMVANIAIELEGMRLMMWRAASRAEQGLSFTQQAYLAHLQAGEKGMEIGSNGVQLLGGHGFTKEHPVERWYRQQRAVAMMSSGVMV